MSLLLVLFEQVSLVCGLAASVKSSVALAGQTHEQQRIGPKSGTCLAGIE